ncbi:MAG: MGMT family protein [Desulfofustis sp.]|nr:MGMT family protein [Desulfofustis sp.]MBT8354407.1 MGMT family protein [Desulfofustis sp.]NNF47096.1 DNA methyltransferase [Desulfofustis sp.]NNK57036.1 DNA methyltransferase [Desulfofustis sp.]
MDPFTRKVIDIIQNIPSGKVTTYLTVATAAGNHCGARQVARILHSSSEKYGLPWHRVVNQKRTISPRSSGSHLIQQTMLEAEGVFFDHNGRIDSDRFFWLP